MKIDHLVSAIRKGLWFIDHNNIDAYTPIIDKLLKGEKIDFNSQFQTGKTDAVSYVNRNSQKVNTEEGVPDGSYAVVSMVGEVIKYGSMCVWGADEITQQLYEADRNPNVKGTIFKVDGPGGAVDAMGVFEQFAKNKTKPIIGLADNALSLHYWTITSLCDRVIADNNISARFGSVGVMLSFRDGLKAMEEKGYKHHEVYSNLSEHKNDAYRLAREGKYDLIKSEHLDPLALKFQNAIKANRPQINHQATGVITGKTFYADEALSLGMIDGIGDLQMAIDQIEIMNAINNLNNN